jgi:hypothetical protein
MLHFVVGLVVGAVAMWSVYRFKVVAEYKAALRAANDAYEALYQRARKIGL